MSSQKLQVRISGFLSGYFKVYLLVFLLFAVFITGIVIGRQSDEAVINNAQGGEVYNAEDVPEFLSKDADFQLFWDTWEIVKAQYVDQPVNEAELLYGAMTGIVASLGDPHSVFFDPKTTDEFNQELEGSFEGIGAEIAIKKDILTIVAPLKGSPAMTAGLHAGDKIYAIDGKDTAGISLDEAVNSIRGPKGSQVVLSISGDGLDEVKEVTVTRDTIKIDSVSWEMKGDIAYIDLSYFHNDTSDAFDNVVEEIVAKNPKGIILDLRGNPGGLLDSAIDVASEWVEDGFIVYEKSSTGKLKKHSAKGTARLKDYKTIILMNQGSASASEIVAGALKDHGKATLLGEKTFGKGSVQTLFFLNDGSSIKLTIAKWLTPNENMIDQQGIDPDVEVKRTDEDFENDIDPQLDKALEMMKQ